MLTTPITLFTTPKPFVGQFGVVQRNALASWRALSPSVEILVFGDEAGAADAAAAIGATHLPEVRRNAAGTPLISAMFEEAQRLANAPVLVYANADIIFLQDLLAAIALVEAQPRPYLLTGRRHDTDVTALVDFGSPDEVADLRRHAMEQGRKYPPVGMDYFAFRRGSITGLPDLVVGRPRWDNYMIYHARQQGDLVIDATDAVLAIHQNHDYSHHAEGTKGVWEGEEAEENLMVAGGWMYVFTLKHATHRLGPDGLHRARQPLTPEERFYEYLALHRWTDRPYAAARRLKAAVLRRPLGDR